MQSRYSLAFAAVLKITAIITINQEGHHRKVFASTFKRATIELVDGTPRIRIVLVDETERRPEVDASSGPLVAD